MCHDRIRFYDGLLETYPFLLRIETSSTHRRRRSLLLIVFLIQFFCPALFEDTRRTSFLERFSFDSHIMYHSRRVILYFDGASRNNPRGPAGYGWVLYEMDEYGANGDFIAEDSGYLGYNISNNQAEYEGLTQGLVYIRDNVECDGIYIRGDAEIVIRQMDGQYAVRSQNIIPYYKEAMDVLNEIDCRYYSFRHVKRSANWQADQLANDAIDDYC